MDSTNSCDLRHMFGNVRDQYSRPTCVAFAVSDAHAAVRPNWNELSCEYAFFQAISRHKSDPNDGVSLENILEVIYRIGQPLEQNLAVPNGSPKQSGRLATTANRRNTI